MPYVAICTFLSTAYVYICVGKLKFEGTVRLTDIMKFKDDLLMNYYCYATTGIDANARTRKSV